MTFRTVAAPVRSWGDGSATEATAETRHLAASDTRGTVRSYTLTHTHSSLQAQNKLEWDTMIWNNMKQKWECSPILEQENRY